MTVNAVRRVSNQGIVIAILVVFFIAMLGGIYLVSNSSLSGREFSPDLFQHREFRFLTIPGTRIRLTATTLGTSSSPCTKHILNNLRKSNQPVEWQVLEANRGVITEKRGPDILYDYLTFKNADGHSYWDDWSFRNPNLAAVLWPVVQQAAIRDLYFCVPELMRTAESVAGPAELNRQLKRVCLEAALKRSSHLSESGNSSSLAPTKGWATEFAGDLNDDVVIKELISKLE
jgi:hypothetical protein